MSTIERFALRSAQSTEQLASKSIRKALRWQILAACLLAVVAGCWIGWNGAVSAMLGGLVNASAGWVYSMMIKRRAAKTIGETLRTLVRAESSKIALIVIQLWLVLTAYRNVVPTAFFAAFVTTVLLFPLALIAGD